MKVFYFIMFFTALTLCSCSEESSTTNSEIVLADGTSTLMQFKADDDGSNQLSLLLTILGLPQLKMHGFL